MEYENLNSKMDRIMEYCDKRRMRNDRRQLYIIDTLNRHIIDIENKWNKKIELLNCIKGFYLTKKCTEYYDELIEKYGLKNISENARLLLIQSIYLEHIIYEEYDFYEQ